MSNLNVVAVEGRLTKDVEMTIMGASQTAVAKFSIANNEYRKGTGESNEEVSFFEVVAFGKLAEVCAKYLTKGSKVNISGKLKQDRWTDKQGQSRSKVYVKANEVSFLSKSEQTDVQQNGNFSNDFFPPQDDVPNDFAF